MSLWTLSLTLAFVVGAMLVSLWQRLGLERDMVVATVRATIQLLIIGYILKFVFHVDNIALTAAMVTLMTCVAADNAGRRGRGLAGRFWRPFAAIAATEVLTQGFLLVAHVIPPKPSYIIPISGMIIGNSMVASGLFLNRLRDEAKSRRPEVLALLALGANPKQASRRVLKAATKASMIPTIDSAKTMGLVQLPGMMTGQIIAGADPIQAVRYQLLIVFAIIASAAITSIVLGFLTYSRLFNRHWQPTV
ncbi:MAG: iron export ABC transporter permease subunit FetB [Alicyclobacillus herbarius]|uniref:ABC transporter permease n=1 Tax=Alicyclobacillus herbarius TaxID=122960 RepID=UPI000423345E|nr:iron export ABC transporter permease subunit FetB [Alicyclobacillus herbarius]MCL6632817.1 iron export ABC transporter permease subunit FetB [Alicyclobacillus herbarius]